jgi:heme-degrading monooxygenase HmoA
VHVILWRFRAVARHRAEFEAAYGPDGEWARLFRADPAFLGTSLLRGTDETYLTLDRWSSGESARAFRERYAEAYAELDARCEELTEDEAALGAVDV